MTNIELYINGKLADIGRDFGIRLNRQILNPAELNTKDAQYSFSISLPPTERNHAIFNYANIEETRDKFNRLYTAELIVNSIRVFPPTAGEGRFKLADIKNGYKGNLYIPVKKSIKDIFGELKLNQNPELRIPFSDFATSVSEYNEAAAAEPQIAIFPYTLYGVLPKTPVERNTNNYSARNIWDASVRVSMADFAPSINPLLMLKHIFNAQGYNLQGDAFDDDRLTRLYMSYKNADSYVQPWNYGQHAKIKISGGWGSTTNYRTGAFREFERGVNRGQDAAGEVFACDLFDATNTSINIIEDTGGNVLYKETADPSDLRTWVNCQVRIPTSGFYKVEFNASLRVLDNGNWRGTDGATGVQHISRYTENTDNDFEFNKYEIRLVRDRGGAEFGLNGPKLDGIYYRNNQPQNETFDEANIPKYFPQAEGVNFVDLAQDRYHVLGFSFGRKEGQGAVNNPKDGEAGLSHIQAAKPSLSWDTTEDTANPTRLAIASAGYWKYGRLGSFDSEGDNPNLSIDYSAGPFVNGGVLDAQGNPQTPFLGNTADRVTGFKLDVNTGLPVAAATWEVTDFIDVSQFADLTFSAQLSGASGVAIVAFYDMSQQYIGFGVQGVAGSVTYTNELITPIPSTVYVRLSGLIANPLTITPNSASAGNVILHRFTLARFYTYKITTDPADGYTGYAYIHNGADTNYMQRIEFVNGEVIINTSFGPLLSADPKLTLYLKTPSYDVNGTLDISREILVGSADVVDWELTDKYAINLINAPANFATRGMFNGAGGQPDLRNGQGSANAVVWFEAGELLSVGSVSYEGRYRRPGMHSTFGWVEHDILFDLSVQPFRVDKDWLKVDLRGNGTAVMDWNDASNFDTDSINVVGFLSADVKTDDFIDNFCKAFNLRLSQIDLNTFSLDVKQSKRSVSNLFINLDKFASVRDRSNSPLGLPSIYKLGFTVDPEEEGFAVSGDNGGGQFETGTTDEGVVEQKSNFSYNWFKNITKKETGGDVVIPLPVISKAEVWAPAMAYPEAMRKRYTDLAIRFWYYNGLLNDLGATFDFNGVDMKVARVSNELGTLSILNYKNQRNTILDNFFTLLINGSSHYTEIEGYLTAPQYQQLDGAIMAMFNGDLYYVAEISAYDPNGRNKTKIKLIRKI